MSKIGLTVRSVMSGIAATALETLAMDASLYRRYRHGGGTADFPAWEFSEGLTSWDNAPGTRTRGEEVPRERARP